MGELSAALRAIERRHPTYHWHCWHSNAGLLWATSPHCPEPLGSGTTVGDVRSGAGSPEVLEREIAKVERKWAELEAAAA